MNQHIVIHAESQIRPDLKSVRLYCRHIIDDIGYAEGDFCDILLQLFSIHACFQQLDLDLLGDLVNEYRLAFVELFGIEF